MKAFILFVFCFFAGLAFPPLGVVMCVISLFLWACIPSGRLGEENGGNVVYFDDFDGR